MARRYYDLITIITIAILNIVWAMLPIQIPVIGTIFALPLVFVLPGYTLTEILFQRRLPDVVHRILLSLGLSLAIDVLGGFLLGISPVGLGAKTWAIFLGFTTILFSLWLALRRRKVFSRNSAQKIFKETPLRLILIGLSLVGIIFAIGYSAVSVIQEPNPGFTQMWVLPSKQIKESCAVSVGVRSFEATATTFRVVMKANDSQVATWPSIVLMPQKEWEQQVPINLGAPRSIDIEAQLYRADKPEIVFRDVHLTLRSVKSGGSGQDSVCTS